MDPVKGGRPQATGYLEELDRKISNKDIRGLSNFEDRLLDMAENDFEFVSLNQKVSLQRIKDDRNLCAHPAFSSTGTLFDPLPELARTHIVHAVNHLLRNAPVRGRSSLRAIVEDIKSEAFPITQDAAGQFLNKKYLEYAKPVLTSNLLSLLVKATLQDLEGWQGYRENAVRALIGISVARSYEFESWMASNFAKFADSLEGNQIFRIIGLIVRDGRFWHWAAEQHHIQLRAFLESVGLPSVSDLKPADSGWEMFAKVIEGLHGTMERGRLAAAMGLNSVEQLFDLLDISALQAPLLSIFNNLSENEQINVISKTPRREFVEAAVKMYSGARGFRQAEHGLPPLTGSMC